MFDLSSISNRLNALEAACASHLATYRSCVRHGLDVPRAESHTGRYFWERLTTLHCQCGHHWMQSDLPEGKPPVYNCPRCERWQQFQPRSNIYSAGYVDQRVLHLVCGDPSCGLEFTLQAAAMAQPMAWACPRCQTWQEFLPAVGDSNV